MRDPTRIPRIIAKLGALWASQPDTRLGQLVMNHMIHPQADPFVLEDTAWEREIDAGLRRAGIDPDQVVAEMAEHGSSPGMSR